MRSIVYQSNILLLFLFVFLHLDVTAYTSPYFPGGEARLAIKIGNRVSLASDEFDRSVNTKNLSGINKADFYAETGDWIKALKEYRSIFHSLVNPPDRKKFTGQSISVFTLSAALDKRHTTTEYILKYVDDKSYTKEEGLLLGTVLHGLGLSFHQMGNLKVADLLYQKALEVRGKYAGKTSLYFVSSLQNLAVLRTDQGRYSAAEDMFKYITNYYQIKFTINSLNYAIVVNNQAMLYTALGRTNEASVLINSIVENSNIPYPDHSLERENILVNKALIQMEMGQYNQSTQILSEVASVYKEKGLTSRLDYHQLNMYLAQSYLSEGALNELNGFIDETLNQLEKDLDTESLPFSYALEVKANYLLQKKEYALAFEHYQQIATTRLNKIGELHTDYLRIVNKGALCQWLNGDRYGAFQRFQSVTSAYMEVVDKYFYNMSENEKTRFWNALKSELDIFYSFVLSEHASMPQLLPIAYDLRMKTKGLLLHNSNSIRNTVYNESESELIEKYENWLANKEVLAGFYSLDKASVDALNINVIELETESNELEKELNRAISGGISNNRVSHEMVSQALGDGEVAIEIMNIKNQYGTKSDQYVAFVLTEGRILKLVNIGESSELDGKMSVYYKNSMKNKIPESLSFQKYWQPIHDQIQDAKKVYISLDGIYNLISLNSLKNEDDEYLIDLIDINIVPNTSILANRVREELHNEDYVLIGNPNFENPSIAQLPGTANEISSISLLVNSSHKKVLTGGQATEQALKAVKKPKVLHIATHGFFLAEHERSNTLSVADAITKSNPLMRSGLLMTGAGGTPDFEIAENISDGIFTAYEAMNLKLQNTDVVVLSACETGKGEVVNGEGVYGLSRAFTVAGAKHLIMSLWKVDDQATQQLMTNFYKEWAVSGDLKSSFIYAQQQVKMNYEAPYYWASFILVNNEL